MNQPYLIEVNGLKKYFPLRDGLFGQQTGELRAVDDVSFNIRPGTIFGLVGESGSGKTTVGRTLLGLYEKTAGSIKFRGQELSELSAAAMQALRPKIQLVFQDPYSSLNPRIRVGEAIGEAMLQHKLCTRAELYEKVIAVMKICGLAPQHYHRFPHEFSGGQRQRIGVARALALDPKLVVCDEPVSALDVSIQAQILNLMRELQRKYQLTYIFISHNLSVVKHICDRIAVMYLGNIVEIAPKKELFDNPLHPYTKALLGAIPIPDPDIPAMQDMLEGDVPSPINPPKGCCFHTRCHGCCKECTAQKPKLINVGNDHWVACCKV